MDERREARRARSENRHYRGSLFFPLILIAVGVIFLLNNLGVVSGDIWSNVAQFWPVILIAIGLDSIYRREGLVGAAFVIGLGVVFLLANLGYLALDIWQIVLRLWPLLIIAIGFDILIGRRSLLASLAGLIVILVLMAGALWLTGVRVEQSQALPGETIRQELQGARRARLDLEPGAGGLRLNALSETGALISGAVKPGPGTAVSDEIFHQGDLVTYTLRSSGTTVTIPGDRGKWNWDLGVTPAVPLDLKIGMGAGEVDANLAGLNLSALEVNTAVGVTTVTLPSQGNFQGSLESAIGETVILVPPGMAVRIRADSGFASVNVPSSYQKQDKVYTSPGYDSAQNRVDLQVSQAIGSIRVEER